MKFVIKPPAVCLASQVNVLETIIHFLLPTFDLISFKRFARFVIRTFGDMPRGFLTIRSGNFVDCPLNEHMNAEEDESTVGEESEGR